MPEKTYERTYLKESVLLCGESDEKKFTRMFKILERIEEDGATNVCYRAQYDRSATGVLKEFYPRSIKSPERDENGQLRYDLMEYEDIRQVKEYMDRYTEIYDVLLKLKRKNEALASFIPHFEIYYGCDENKNIIGSVYIWSPDPERETFEKICEEIHKHPGVNPERKLLDVLCTTETLLKCVIEMHKAGVLHRDIKPANFGLLKRNEEEVLAQTVTLFDVDSICSVYDTSDGFLGSEGFTEPELNSTDACNLTDIYSIGATLFYAATASDETKQTKYCYNKRYYNDLKKIVDGAELIQCSEVNSHKYLRDILVKIMQKSLCERHCRYTSCEEMLKDVQDAIYYMLPSEIAKKRLNGNDKALQKAVNELFSGKGDKNSTRSVLYHLWEHPLYTYVKKESEYINVLCIGFGKYGTKFLDVALQMCQMPGKKINAYVLSDNKEDKEMYIKDRPELDNFFDVNGSMSGSTQSYGTISFEVHTLPTDKSNDQIWEKYFGGECPPDYVFTAVGDDKKNRLIASAVRKAADKHNKNCLVCAVCEAKKTKNSPPDKDFVTLYLNEDVKRSSLHRNIERMALNVHLIWEKNLNIDFNKVRKVFRDRYYYNSCVAFVLAMKYKLYGIGIDMNSAPEEEIAKKYLNYINENSDNKKELIWLEHRRWVTEKLCDGYTRITDLDSCVTGKTKDIKNKKHICILTSSPDDPLSGKEWTHEKWDSPLKAELESLDELDRMSVELHMTYRKQANEASKNNILNGEIVSAVRNRIDNSPAVISAFQELITCMKDINDGESEQWRRYEGLKDAFLYEVENAKDISKNDKNTVQQLLQSLYEQFYPIYASKMYRSYKKDDVKLVEGIPFVLTYSDLFYMVIPYKSSEAGNDDAFANVAAATMVNPSRIIYLSYCDKDKKIEEIKKSLAYQMGYINKKKIRASVEFVIGYNNNVKIGRYEGIEKDFSTISKGRVKKVKMVKTNSVYDFAEYLEDYLDSRRKDKTNFFIERNDTALGGVLTNKSMCSRFSVYAFDAKTMKFQNVSNSEKLKYINFKPFITVTDLTAFRLSSSDTSDKPEFYGDYKALWNRYKDNSAVWKSLARILGSYSENSGVLANFNPAKSEKGGKELNYILPSSCRKAVEKIFEVLKKGRIISEKSSVESRTSNSCNIIIADAEGQKSKFDRLFSQIHALVQPERIDCFISDASHNVKVIYDDLCVRDMDISGLKKDARNLLDFFAEKKYIINLEINETTEKANFTYATYQIKQLLTTEGKILEIYTYHKALETGEFDDIRSGFEITWENDIAKNEFDCILTKGFSTLFVECKATKDEIKADYYTKLAALVDYFGINATAVLVADTQTSDWSAETVKRRIELGERLDVITITDRADINNIGYKLVNIINKSRT